MLTDMPPSDHAREDIHEQREIDEASLETHISNIADPDLIASTDLKRLQAIHPRRHPFSGVRRLTGNPLDCDCEVRFFHQSGQPGDTQRGIPPSPASV